MTGDIIDQDDARPWLDLLDELRSLGIGDDFPIPQIAVIGDQSSGKSSLLEALSGIAFPRGVGLVTRCPTCISMHKIVVGQNNRKNQWSAEVSISDPESTKNFKEIRGLGRLSSPSELADRISSIMGQLVENSNAEFSSTIINIRIEGTDVPDLTIIDLPGIIRTTTVGQNQSVIEEVDRLLDHFLRQSRTIILAVIPANQDIATIDVLERAQKVDPMGSRTIGVLTKLDLVDQGAEEETLAVISNKRKPLALGYVAVKNRSQAQIRSNLSLEKAYAEEEKYFSQHSVWKAVDPSVKGIRALSKKLTSVLLKRAADALPEMKWDLLHKLEEVMQKRKDLGVESFYIDPMDRWEACLRILSRFGSVLRQIMNGEYRDSFIRKEPSLHINIHIEEIQRDLRAVLSGKVPDLDSEGYNTYLVERISKLRGRELPGFLSARLLLSLVSSDIDDWRCEVENSFALAVEIFERAAKKLIETISPQYPKLCALVMQTVGKICSTQTREMSRRTDEMFDSGAVETISNDTELIDYINMIRRERFEKLLKELLDAAGSEEGPAVDSPSEIKMYIKAGMGHNYMHLHGMERGPNVHVEDARAVLKAYWRMIENRVHDHAAAAIENVLLIKGSQDVELQLLEVAHELNPRSFQVSGGAVTAVSASGASSETVSSYVTLEAIYSKTGGVTLDEVMAVDPGLQAQFEALEALKTKLEKALKLIDELAPNCVATVGRNAYAKQQKRDDEELLRGTGTWTVSGESSTWSQH